MENEEDDKIKLGEPDKLPKSPLMYGWICPRCGTVHSPFVTRCDCPPPTKTCDSINTEEGIIYLINEWEFNKTK